MKTYGNNPIPFSKHSQFFHKNDIAKLPLIMYKDIIESEYGYYYWTGDMFMCTYDKDTFIPWSIFMDYIEGKKYVNANHLITMIMNCGGKIFNTSLYLETKEELIERYHDHIEQLMGDDEEIADELRRLTKDIRKIRKTDYWIHDCGNLTPIRDDEDLLPFLIEYMEYVGELEL
jgi:hypothetical protein